MNTRWRPLKTTTVTGLQGERLDLWRNHRLWFIAESGYLIDGFECRPGVHPWQGEHLGKWLHAATLAYQMTGDERLEEAMRSFVERLLATQDPNGYLGTYAADCTFMAMPENSSANAVHDDMDASKRKKLHGGWDTWTHRYNLYGLLTYERIFPDERIVDACRRMADLLIEVYGEGKYDLTEYGTRKGISATTLIESIVMLHERTQDQKYLDFAEHIVNLMEGNPALKLMNMMLQSGTVVHPGEGKGYQLMANLLGFIALHGCTGKAEYLNVAINGWREIKEKHILVTGGPWSRKTDYNANCECFAHVEDFDPQMVSVEGCCDTTWIQLCLHLFELTGECRYIDEAEVTLYNSLYGHQHADGVKWCYYTAPNQAKLPYSDKFQCCHSSMPRAMEMVAANLVGQFDGHLTIATLSPCSVELTERFGGGRLVVKSGFPKNASAEIRFETECSQSFVCEFRLPAGTVLNTLSVNGETVQPTRNDRGFYEVQRLWQNGDVLKIDAAFELHSHVQSGENGKHWVAFSCGPNALAQKINTAPTDEPFAELSAEEALQKLRPSADGSLLVQGTDIVLMPFLRTCTEESGPRTYWRCR